MFGIGPIPITHLFPRSTQMIQVRTPEDGMR